MALVSEHLVELFLTGSCWHTIPPKQTKIESKTNTNLYSTMGWYDDGYVQFTNFFSAMCVLSKWL